MSMLTRWEPLRTRMNPFRELEEMEKRLSTIFGRQSLRPDGEKEAMSGRLIPRYAMAEVC